MGTGDGLPVDVPAPHLSTKGIRNPISYTSDRVTQPVPGPIEFCGLLLPPLLAPHSAPLGPGEVAVHCRLPAPKAFQAGFCIANRLMKESIPWARKNGGSAGAEGLLRTRERRSWTAAKVAPVILRP